MADDGQHLPKLAALDAYGRGLLGAQARARVERHLAACPTCREALEGMRRYAALADAAFASPPPAIDWVKLERPLQREHARLLRRARLRRARLPAALAAAAGLGLFLASHPLRPHPEGVARVAPPAPAPAPPLLLRTEVTAVSGSVEAVDGRGGAYAVDLSSSPQEGWVLQTGTHGEVHLAIEGAAALIVGPESRLALRTLRPGTMLLELLGGRVVSHVRKLQDGERYEVAVAGKRVAVRGTRFAVELEPQYAPARASEGGAGSAASPSEAGLGLLPGVELDEGTVVVLDAAGKLLAELHAPARWGRLRPSPRLHGRALPRPYEAVAGSAHWPALELPTWPHVTQWQVGEAELGAGGELRMRAPPGPLQLRALLDDGRLMQARVEVELLGTRFDPKALRLVNAPQAVAGGSRAQAIDPAAVAMVIRMAGRALQRCYERAMRSGPGSSLVHMRLRVELDAGGGVKGVELASDGPVPALLGQCVKSVAQRWHFPSPGPGGARFEAPISFRPIHSN